MKGYKGFTLVETVITLILISVLSVFIGSFILTFSKAWLGIARRDAAVNQTRFAMNRLVAEMRRINSPENITRKLSADCQFQDVALQNVNYKQQGTNLYRNMDILLTNLATPEGLRFSYLDALSAPTGVTKNIRSIRIWLYVTAGDQRVTLESSARIRNL